MRYNSFGGRVGRDLPIKGVLLCGATRLPGSTTEELVA